MGALKLGDAAIDLAGGDRVKFIVAERLLSLVRCRCVVVLGHVSRSAQGDVFSGTPRTTLPERLPNTAATSHVSAATVRARRQARRKSLRGHSYPDHHHEAVRRRARPIQRTLLRLGTSRYRSPK